MLYRLGTDYFFFNFTATTAAGWWAWLAYCVRIFPTETSETVPSFIAKQYFNLQSSKRAASPSGPASSAAPSSRNHDFRTEAGP